MLVTAAVNAERNVHLPVAAHIRRPDLYEPREDFTHAKLMAPQDLEDFMNEARTPYEAGLQPVKHKLEKYA